MLGMAPLDRCDNSKSVKHAIRFLRYPFFHAQQQRLFADDFVYESKFHKQRCKRLLQPSQLRKKRLKSSGHT